MRSVGSDALARYGLAVALLILPFLLIAIFVKEPGAGPLVSLAFLVAVAAAGWLFGLGPGIASAGVSMTGVTLIATRGAHLVQPLDDLAAAIALLLTAFLCSRAGRYRKRPEQALPAANPSLEGTVQERASELETTRDWFRTTLASIGDAVVTTDTAGNVNVMNFVAQALTGWSDEDASGKPLEQVFHIANEETRDTVENPVSRVLRQGIVVGLADHTVLIRRDGREFSIEYSAAPIRSQNGDVLGVVLIFRDVTERRKIEAERDRLLQETEAAHQDSERQRAHLQSLLMQAPVAINILSGPDHVYEFAHPLTRARWNRDITGLTMREVYGPSGQEHLIRMVDEVYATGEPYAGKEIMIKVVKPEGSMEERYFDLTATPWRDGQGHIAGVITMAADVTDHVQSRRAVETAEERLRESAKLESLGLLAGGIAHDFNNLLVGILGYASLAQEMLPPESPVRELIAHVVSASEKAAALTRQMLAYSGRGTFVLESLDLGAMVREILPLVSRAVPPNVSVELRLPAGLPGIDGDSSQVQQVIMNLVINAAEACRNGAGVITISTAAAQMDPHTLPAVYGLPPISPGSFVCLEVRDTGSGMTDEVKARIFDPFYTTKLVGRGLGLAATLGIIRAHKGGIQVESEPGNGSAFRIYFPASQAVAGTPETHSEPHVSGVETILVVDDEELVRATARLGLERFGYQVLTAENGELAVKLFREQAGRIALVILDLSMPVLGGEQTFEQLRGIDPSIPVVLSSGYNVTDARERFRDRNLAGFLQKPYTATRLAEEVRAALGRGARAHRG